MTDLQLLMNDIKAWSDVTFGTGERTIPILYHLRKEIPEVIDAIKKSKDKEISTVLMEFADCFMLLLDAASHHGYNAEDLLFAATWKLEVNKKRKWGKPDKNGVVEHLKEENE